MRHFNKVAGEDVILAHRLLKNSIHSNEYLLLTEAFHQLMGSLEDQVPERRKEQYEGLGSVNIMVYYPSLPVQLQTKRSSWNKLKMMIKFNIYLFKRLVVKPKRYRNLEAVQQIDETDLEHA